MGPWLHKRCGDLIKMVEKWNSVHGRLFCVRLTWSPSFE